MRRPVPYRTHGTVARPASGHSCWRTSVMNSTDSLLLCQFQPREPQLATALAAEIGPALVTWWARSTPGPAVAVFKSSKCTCVKISASVRTFSLSRMPGNHVHGNGLPATFVPSRRNVFEGYWAADESLKKITRFSFPLTLERKRQPEKHSTSKPNRSILH